jgi:hypothetical protein
MSDLYKLLDLVTRHQVSKQRQTQMVPGVGEVIEAAGAGEDDESDLRVAKDGELLGLLEQPGPALREGHLPARRVFDPLDHYLPSPHLLLHSTDLERDTDRERQRDETWTWLAETYTTPLLQPLSPLSNRDGEA